MVSIVTGWEIVLKPKLERSAANVEAAIASMGAVLLPIRFEHLNELSILPFRDDHRDPFDRMLIAQARRRPTDHERRHPVTGYKRLRVIWD